MLSAVTFPVEVFMVIPDVVGEILNVIVPVPFEIIAGTNSRAVPSVVWREPFETKVTLLFTIIVIGSRSTAPRESVTVTVS